MTKKGRIPKEIFNVIELQDALILNFLSSLPKKLDLLESHDECYLKIYQIIQHANAVSTLAKKNNSFYPSALILSRSALESAVTVAWILQSKNIYENEARWLRIALKSKNSEFNFGFKYIKHMEDMPESERIKQTNENIQIKRWYEDIVKVLEESFPGQYDYHSPVPDMKKMCEELNFNELYFYFSHTSQYVHGGFVSTQLYRRGYGAKKGMRDLIRPSFWTYCFYLTSMSIFNAGKIFLERTDGNVDRFQNFNFSELDNAFQELIKINDKKNNASDPLSQYLSRYSSS